MGTAEGITRGFYEDIKEAAAHIVDVLSGILKVNTIFVATNDGVTNFLKKTAIRQQDTSPLGTRALLVGEGNKTNVTAY